VSVARFATVIKLETVVSVNRKPIIDETCRCIRLTPRRPESSCFPGERIVILLFVSRGFCILFRIPLARLLTLLSPCNCNKDAIASVGGKKRSIDRSRTTSPEEAISEHLRSRDQDSLDQDKRIAVPSRLVQGSTAVNDECAGFVCTYERTNIRARARM